MGKINFLQFNRLRKEPRPIQESFWEKVDVRSKDECWEWLAAVTKDGYGSFKSKLAHRVAWELEKGEIPDGMLVCHTCDNPPCCNPSHLFLGTQRNNMDDMVQKGRSPNNSGSKNPKAKFIEQDILDIYRLHNSGMSAYRIAKNYSVSESNIHSIVKGKTWKYLWEHNIHVR